MIRCNNDSLLAELANDVNPSLQAEQNATMLQEPNVAAESYRPGLFARLAGKKNHCQACFVTLMFTAIVINTFDKYIYTIKVYACLTFHELIKMYIRSFQLL